jgi:hypothetical protein
VENLFQLVLHPRDHDTLILGLRGRDEILRAALGHPSQTHHRAAPMLLEALALWHQQPLRVVLSVDSDQTSSCLGLSDGFGVGHRTLHYQVEVVERDAGCPAKRLGGIADFRGLRRLATGRSR